MGIQQMMVGSPPPAPTGTNFQITPASSEPLIGWMDSTGYNPMGSVNPLAPVYAGRIVSGLYAYDSASSLFFSFRGQTPVNFTSIQVVGTSINFTRASSDAPNGQIDPDFDQIFWNWDYTNEMVAGQVYSVVVT